MDDNGGKKVLCNIPVNEFIPCDPCDFGLSQMIPLNTKEKDIVEISIKNKVQFISSAYLKICCLNDNEDIIFKDSVEISNTKWKTNKISFKAGKTKLINIIIEGLRKPDKRKQIMFLDKMQININGNNIYDIKEKPTDIKKLNEQFIVKYPFPVAKILNQKTRIIGLGETVHGNEHIGNLTFELIKDLIENDSCKLVLLEVPFDLGLLLNQYVQSDNINSEILLKKINEILQPFSYNNDTILIFLNWLRNHNKNTLRKVYIGGLDDVLMFDYPILLSEIISTFPIDCQEPLSYALQESYNKLSDRLAINASYYKSKIGEDNYQLFSYLVNCYVNAYDMTFRGNAHLSRIYVKRDKTMFNNILKMIDIYRLENEKIVLYAHYTHLNKKFYSTDINYQNLGYYLNERFHHAYFSIALLTDETNNDMSDSGMNCFLPENSIEKICTDASCPDFYYPTSKLSPNILLMRSHPNVETNVHFNSFRYVSLKSRVDGIFFINRNSPFFKTQRNVNITKR
jgi:hypothetical protein